MQGNSTDSHLLRFQKGQKYICYDVESESLALCGKNRPWQIAWCIFNNKEILETHEHHIWWDDLNVSPGAAQVTRFNFWDYKNSAEDSAAVLKKFEKFYLDPKLLLVAANSLQFDVYLINTWRNELGLPSDYSHMPRQIDIQAIQKMIYAGQKEVPVDPVERICAQYRHSNTRIRGQKTNVKHLCGLYSLPYSEEDAHSAKWDVETTAKIFQRQLYGIDI